MNTRNGVIYNPKFEDFFFEGSKTLFESLEIYKDREKQNQNHGGKSQIAMKTNYFR